jgi:glycosyltransferase involved in cell wall biosynthesis
MKILLITNQDTTLRFREELISELKRFFDVSICTRLDQNKEWVTSLGLEAYDLPIDRRGKNFFSEIRTFTSIGKTIRNSKPDLILSFTIKPNLYAGFIAKVLRISIIMTITGLGSGIEESRTKRLLLWGYRVIQSKRSAIVFQNKSSMDLFKNEKINPAKHILVNGSGVNVSKFRYQPYPEDESIRFLFIGRLMKSKGIEELAHAIRHFHKLNPSVSFDVVGPMEE